MKKYPPCTNQRHKRGQYLHSHTRKYSNDGYIGLCQDLASDNIFASFCRSFTKFFAYRDIPSCTHELWSIPRFPSDYITMRRYAACGLGKLSKFFG